MFFYVFVKHKKIEPSDNANLSQHPKAGRHIHKKNYGTTLNEQYRKAYV